ncbi:interleukin-1 receptor-associated kinase 4-like [Asterias rubens]|uniref:interleukin-1 receptor-associated kinase 4-like n=1 Tax=Asterias rubens TaxID=7604 RepID=UPI0014556661|nr:interleukin-1 receptor-associated kinase 4-like [Asterias rubens]XP_033647849.1 interleukin-1 receptor-associated kinase 4-like [Asterias rubens]XP_033647850.1 interleukin-1 receptor-associated kinase 4-like [Asterias rubens]XP_033647851.1 interleukin-1 receptor-associated kinase 4-like [Asterias rubens]XP_033647852.1 interleukin-1 receptor-associated kinase 4-like [Asterias rubens]XP_033647853.1 interleukin-1 receptor-associated kinase 4-like [Asterias rubens]XP_033647854.1 interleukin-1 
MPRLTNVQGTTLLRSLPYPNMMRLSQLLDPPTPTFLDWRGLAGRILRNSDGAPRYDALAIANFDLAHRRRGGSPTMELIRDWGTSNATVQDLVGYLNDMGHYAAAESLLPDLNLNAQGQVSSSTVSQDQYESLAEGANFASPSHRLLSDCSSGENGDTQENPKTPSETNDCNEVSSSTGRSSVFPVGASSRLAQEDDESLVTSCLPNFEPNKVQEFSYISLSNMTSGFDDRPFSEGGNMVGEGGFGTVYYGKFNGGHECAVKKLKQDVFPCSDMDVVKQYQNELNMLQSLHHKNLVELYGYSFDGDTPCLVFNYLKNGSVQATLNKDSCLLLSWEVRVRIAQGTAQGLCYLHQQGTVHRDVKSANVLLDDHFTAKLADFGLVRALPLGVDNTHRTSTVIGTSAYMPPEAHFGAVSSKGDSFSYGVVLLEIITGLEPLDKTRDYVDIINHVEDYVDGQPDRILKLVDPRLGSSFTEGSVLQMYAVANDCLITRKLKRPFLKDVLPKLMALDDTSSCTDG